MKKKHSKNDITNLVKHLKQSSIKQNKKANKKWQQTKKEHTTTLSKKHPQ